MENRATTENRATPRQKNEVPSEPAYSAIPSEVIQSGAVDLPAPTRPGRKSGHAQNSLIGWKLPDWREATGGQDTELGRPYQATGSLARRAYLPLK